MTRRCLLLSLVLFVLIGFPAAPLAAQEKPTRLELTDKDIDASLGVEWYGLYFQDKKIGWFKTDRSRQGKGKDAIFRDHTVLAMKLVSMGQKAELTMAQTLEYEAAAPYRLRRAEYSQSDGTVKQQIRLTANEGGYDVTILTGNAKQTKQMPAIEHTLEDALTADVWLRRGPKPGGEITVRDFDVEELKVELSTYKLLATKESLVNGVKVVFHELSSLSHKTKLTTLQRHDDKGRMISGKVADVFEMRRESEEQAKNTAYSADIFVMGMAKVDRALGHTEEVKALVLKAEGKDLDRVIKSGPLQQVTVNKDNSVTIKLGTKYAEPVKATAAEMKEALAESVGYPIADARVKDLAAKAVGDAKTPREKVERLIRFTHDYIRPSLSTTLPKLLDLLDRKAGDCKSYALLFNTLARAAGVPAREVAGLVYMGDGVKAFGGHAWNEVVLDGVWVPVDASIPETDLDAAHLRLGTEQEAIANTAATMGRLTLRVVEVETKK